MAIEIEETTTHRRTGEPVTATQVREGTPMNGIMTTISSADEEAVKTSRREYIRGGWPVSLVALNPATNEYTFDVYYR